MAARVAAQRKSPVWAGIAVSNPDKLMYPATSSSKYWMSGPPRCRGRPFVSMPVTWEELRRAIRAGDGRRLYFEPRAALARLARHGDRYRPGLTLEQALPRQFTSRLAG